MNAAKQPRDWQRTDKDNGQQTFVSAQFVKTALQSALGMEREEAAATIDAAEVGAVLETESFEYTYLGIGVKK